MTISSTSLQTNPQSRFQLIQSAVAAPGSCVTCGTPNGPFIDFGFLAEFYGAVIFCVQCAQDCGRSAGLVDFVQLVEPITVLPNWVPSILNDYEADVNAAMVKLRNCFDVDSLSVLPSVASNGESKTESTEPESTDSEEFGTSSSDSEPFSVEGSSGISDITGNNDVSSGESGTSKS